MRIEGSARRRLPFGRGEARAIALAMTSVTDGAAVGMGGDGPHGKRKGAKYVAGPEILKSVGEKWMG